MFWRRRKSRDDDLERELRAHLELEAEEQQESGLSPEEASYAAKRAFGNTTLVKEQTREMWGWNWLERSKQDLTYAIRMFARTPGFTAIVILTLALGIGATTAMFSIVNAVLLHPLPYRNPDRLVVIWENVLRDPKGPPVFDTYRDFQIWKEHSRSFERLAPATWATGGAILTGIGSARDVLAMPVGVDFFSLLGVAPELGRTFQPDLHQGCTVVLQHDFWIETLGGRKDVIGKVIGKHVALNQTACTIIGVMPAGFAFYPDVAPMWRLITPGSTIARDPKNANVGVFGLLKPGVSIERAQNEVQSLYRNEHRKDAGGIARIPMIYPLAQQFAYLTGPNLRLSIMVLFGAVTFVLLIACVNIANLLLGRSLVRQKELAVRAALGSGRIRLLRQLLTEGLLLSGAGAALGILFAIGAVHLFRILSPIAMPPGTDVRVNGWVLAFTALLAVVTALLFGLIPALKASRVDVIESLKGSSRTASLSRRARVFGKALVAAEVTLSLALLAGAGLLVESVSRLASEPLGFRTNHLITMSITLPKWSYPAAGQREQFYQRVLDRTVALPGVTSAAFASSLPLTYGRFGASTLAVEGRPEPTASAAVRDVSEVSISPEYFRVMGVELERGRVFGDMDQAKSPAVAIVNQALVQKYFPHGNPIGKRIRLGSGRNWISIIGIAANEKDQDFFHQMAWQEIPLVFRPISQNPPSGATLVLRTPTNEIALGAAIQKRIAAIDRTVPVGEVQTMSKLLSKRLSYPRFRAIILGTFAGLALLLAGIGLYGVLAQLISQRTQEFGIRMALGAQKRDVIALVIRQGMVLTGLAAGLTAALALTRFLSGMLYGVKAADPWTLAGVSLPMILVAFFATYIPARRAARVDPMVALRYE